jgi:hypothetical protein
MITLMGKPRRTEIMLSLSFKNKFGLFLYTIVAAKWLALLLRIREVLSSDLYLETSYSD